MPKCSDCGEVKPERDFPSRRTREGIVLIKNPCKECDARKHRQRAVEPPAEGNSE